MKFSYGLTRPDLQDRYKIKWNRIEQWSVILFHSLIRETIKVTLFVDPNLCHLSNYKLKNYFWEHFISTITLTVIIFVLVYHSVSVPSVPKHSTNYFTLFNFTCS